MTVAEPTAGRAPIMLSAGEASGDLHGGTLCRALRAVEPGVRLVGMGGGHMRAAGMEVVVDPTAHAAVGTSEALGHIPALYRDYRALDARREADRQPASVLVGRAGFMLGLARRAGGGGGDD